MPLSARLRKNWRRLVTGLALSLLLTGPVGQVARAADLPRIASINTCTDQLLLGLADPAQIIGLGPYSQDSARSWAAEEASHYPRLSGEAEDILILKPDIVVASLFTKLATREFLKQKGFRVEEFEMARSLDDAKGQIARMGAITGHPDRAATAIARIDTAIARAREAVARKPIRVLAVSRRGWVSGSDGIISSLLAAVGLSNAASDLGIVFGGFASLESIIKVRPDLLLLSDGSSFAEDQGQAFVLHPAIDRLYPAEKRIVIPERLTVCGGPMLTEALETLVKELERVEH